MHRSALARTFAAVALALILCATAVPSPIDAALPKANTAPAVCAYLGVINGTRTIDPGFVSGTKATPPPAATPSPSLPSGAADLSMGVTSASTVAVSAASTPTSDYCHGLPALVPIGARSG